MAIIQAFGTKELIDKLNNLGDDEKTYRKIANAAVNPLKKATKQVLEANKDTGVLVKSIKGKVYKNRNDGTYFAKAFPDGERTRVNKLRNKGKARVDRNAEIGAVLEYGSSKNNQPPNPWVDRAEKLSEKEAIKSMQEALNARIKDVGF